MVYVVCIDMNHSKLIERLPTNVRNKIDHYFEALNVFLGAKDVGVLKSLVPSGVRGLVLQVGKDEKPTILNVSHDVYFDWNCTSDHPGMKKLYEKAKLLQWDGNSLPWETSVDPNDPDKLILPESFLDLSAVKRYGLTTKQTHQLQNDIATWMISQFLHGEQGALFAAAQVTQAVQFFDGKLYGATQVLDEGRHVEVFNRYLTEKLQKSYQINDNLFVIIDALITDSRWDMKFLGMQIMVEGLALGAFGMLYKATKEPLLKELLRRVIHDEARHVNYGVMALKDHFSKLSHSERKEREDWAFEIALLMKNRFMMYEVYEEWFTGLMSREDWRKIVLNAPGMSEFRQTMFSRLMPNLREIGLISSSTRDRYAQAGLLKYASGQSASTLSGESMIDELDRQK